MAVIFKLQLAIFPETSPRNALIYSKGHKNQTQFVATPEVEKFMGEDLKKFCTCDFNAQGLPINIKEAPWQNW